MKAINRKLMRDLWQMKEQVLTIALVVACGIGALIGSLSAYDSLVVSRETYYASGHFAQVFASLKRAPTSLAPRIRDLPGVAQFDTRLVFDTTVDVGKHTAPAMERLISLPGASQPELNRVRLKSGRMIAPGSVRETVINESFAEAHQLRPGDQVTALLNGRLQRLIIVGIGMSPEYLFAGRGGDPYTNDRQFGIFWMDYDALAAAFDMKDAFNDVALTLAPGASEQQVIHDLDQLLDPYGGFGAFGRNDQFSHSMLKDHMKQLAAMAATIPVILLGVSIYLLNILLGRVVAIQRESIAALKALGYANYEVGRHYLRFVLVIALVGCVFGFLLGAVIGDLLATQFSQFFRFPALIFRVPAWLLLISGMASLLAAVSGALGALRRVVRLAPAEAMRPPVPTRYGLSLPEKIGLGRLLSPRARMVSRGLSSRPLRTLLTILGIAFAIPTLISGLFWRDAFDYLMTAQFTRVDRADAVVTFTQPVASHAVLEIAHLPGVTNAEGIRTVGVRLRAGYRSVRTGLLGLPAQPRLRQLLDSRLKPVAVPPEGLVLPDYLGKKLNVQPGDLVTLEVLEGAKPRQQVMVIAFAHDLLGLSAYMDRDALNHLLREGDVVTAVAVSADPAHIEPLYAEVKQLPKVATVSLKSIARDYFKEVSATFILFFGAVLTGFAGAIALGIVYNSARIALQERGWELASLRILGFTQAEVSTILLSELVVQLALALPVGLWLGHLYVLGLSAVMVTDFVRIPPVTYASTYAFAVLTVLVVGIGTAFVVRRRIDHLDMVAVLKARD